LVSSDADGSSAADRLCRTCVQLFGVDGAALSLVDRGPARGTFGASGAVSRRVDEWQFTFEQGPCMDAVRTGYPTLVDDLALAGDRRWPTFAEKAVTAGMRAVFALPVSVALVPVGALDLFRYEAGGLSDAALAGGLLAADLAAIPLMDLLGQPGVARRPTDSDGWEQLAELDRIEVHQATGMVSAQLGVDVADALTRLRAFAAKRQQSVSELAWDIVERRVAFDPTDPPGRPGGGDGSGA
jgi:hypothetical protein